MTPADQIVTGITVLVAGGLLLAILRWTFSRVIAAVGDALIVHINGSLGLDGIREDMAEMKTQTQNLQGQLAGLNAQVHNLEGQLEIILTDL